MRARLAVVYLVYLLAVASAGVALARTMAGGGLHWIDWGTCTNGHCVSHGTN